MTTLETKMEILHDAWLAFSQDEDWGDFIEMHDIGLPLAMLVVQGQALATEAGIKWIESDYDDLCEELGVDKHGDYESLDEIIDFSLES